MVELVEPVLALFSVRKEFRIFEKSFLGMVGPLERHGIAFSTVGSVMSILLQSNTGRKPIVAPQIPRPPLDMYEKIIKRSSGGRRLSLSTGIGSMMGLFRWRGGIGA